MYRLESKKDFKDSFARVTLKEVNPSRKNIVSEPKILNTAYKTSAKKIEITKKRNVIENFEFNMLLQKYLTGLINVKNITIRKNNNDAVKMRRAVLLKEHIKTRNKINDPSNLLKIFLKEIKINGKK